MSFSFRFSNENLVCTVNIDELLPIDESDESSDEEDDLQDSNHQKDPEYSSFEKTTGELSMFVAQGIFFVFLYWLLSFIESLTFISHQFR